MTLSTRAIARRNNQAEWCSWTCRIPAHIMIRLSVRDAFSDWFVQETTGIVLCKRPQGSKMAHKEKDDRVVHHSSVHAMLKHAVTDVYRCACHQTRTRVGTRKPGAVEQNLLLSNLNQHKWNCWMKDECVYWDAANTMCAACKNLHDAVVCAVNTCTAQDLWHDQLVSNVAAAGFKNREAHESRNRQAHESRTSRAHRKAMIVERTDFHRCRRSWSSICRFYRPSVDWSRSISTVDRIGYTHWRIRSKSTVDRIHSLKNRVDIDGR